MDALDRFNENDRQQTQVEADWDAAFSADEAANAAINKVAPRHMLDVETMSKLHAEISNLVYWAIFSQLTAPPSMDSIPY